MGSILKTEIKKAFGGKMFFICLAIGTVIALISAGQNLPQYWAAEVDYEFAKENGMVFNPMHPIFSPYTSWIGGDYQFSMSPLFYMLLPLLAGLAYGWSFSVERKSGYAAQVISRSTKKSQYFLAKYVATFLAGGAVVAIPLLLNLVTISCFIPAYPPDIFYKMYYFMSYHYLRGLFYSSPLAYVGYVILLDFVFAGLFAVVCVALGFFVKNKFAVVLLPFLGVLAVQYLQDNVFGSLIEGTVSPMEFLRGYEVNAVSWQPVLLWFLLLLGLTLGVTWIRGKRDDVL